MNIKQVEVVCMIRAVVMLVCEDFRSTRQYFLDVVKFDELNLLDRAGTEICNRSKYRNTSRITEMIDQDSCRYHCTESQA